MQLPETMRIPIIIEADAKEAREELIKAAIKEALKRNIDVSLFYSEDFVADFVLDLQGSCIFEARRLYAIAKAEKAAKYLKYLSEGIDQPLIVFFHHREVLEILMSEVDGSYIDGTVSEKRRAEIVDQFQKGNIKVLYLSLKTGSLGLNLTATDTVVFVEYDWVPANLLQAEARVNRIGQKSETIFAYYLTTTDQIERRILDRLFYKAQLCYRLLGGEEFHI